MSRIRHVTHEAVITGERGAWLIRKHSQRNEKTVYTSNIPPALRAALMEAAVRFIEAGNRRDLDAWLACLCPTVNFHHQRQMTPAQLAVVVRAAWKETPEQREEIAGEVELSWEPPEIFYLRIPVKITTTLPDGTVKVSHHYRSLALDYRNPAWGVKGTDLKETAAAAGSGKTADSLAPTRLRDFLSGYLTVEAGSDYDELISWIRWPVDSYYGKDEAESESIIADHKAYAALWPVRRHEIVEITAASTDGRVIMGKCVTIFHREKADGTQGRQLRIPLTWRLVPGKEADRPYQISILAGGDPEPLPEPPKLLVALRQHASAASRIGPWFVRLDAPGVWHVQAHLPGQGWQEFQIRE
jgi:hypothetical protein